MGLNAFGKGGHGGAELARLALRVAVGGTMIAHGVKHARTLEGTAGWFESIGFREPDLQARASAAVEIGGGAALAAGFLTPLSASSVIGTMAVAARTVHWENGFFITKEGYEYVAVLAVAATAVAALGAGNVSVDKAVAVPGTSGGAGLGLAALGLGLLGAAAQLRAFWKPVRA
jgi:putative oxidoreductase